MAEIWVKPGAGLIVRDPRNQQLVPADGVGVDELNLDFARMLADGDVVRGERPAEPVAAPPEPPAPPPAPAKAAPPKETDA